MAVGRGIIVRCDWQDCDTPPFWLISSPPATLEWARQKAQGYGWERTEVFDLCPEHAGRRPVQR